MAGLAVPVFLDDWQIECCEDPPGPGDQVGWPLVWLGDAAGPGGTEVDWQSDPLPAEARNEPGDRVLRHGPLAAYWRGLGPAPAHGRLLADVHGGVPDQVPVVHGTVLAVDVVDQVWRLDGPRTYVPVPGDFRMRRVARGPKWFDGGAAGRDALPDPVRWDSGVLVRLAVGPR
ncbi:DUF6578 domain-containing protein [Blastococcus tunisiensis]|uniref:Uncharacterized protein n=1 Tax=Blastococcus tunisiensis TaxID=1798228 RepID=A0A1I1W8I5_9ACTN|nr:DUF6578 domain-containing protein [Blastococcus sp. DSM 46838]SFD90738.1 hypothetical protein SAMN05216574_101259 [Blastococcus sp. DSM 46838]